LKVNFQFRLLLNVYLNQQFPILTNESSSYQPI